MTRKHDRSRRTAAATPPAPAPAGPPATVPLVVAAVVAAACTLLSVSYRLYEGDVWHHLLVGKVIWQTHAVPTTQQWSWPTFGAPEANSAWLFRALLWPFWSIGGVTGLFVWRWLTTLVVFGAAWMVARRSGAVSFLPIFGIALAALVCAQRSDVRPESLVAVLIVVTIGLLERRTEPSGPRGVRGALPLVLVAWVWANVHLSWPLVFVLIAAYALRGREARRTLAIAAGLSAIAAFVTPFGWRAVWLPFEYALRLRDEPMYRTIVELQPVDWSIAWRSGLPVLLVLWPASLVARARRRGVDWTEILLCVLATAAALSAQRFSTFYAVIAAPFVARDLGAWAAARPWPRWTRPAWPRAVLTAAACVAVSIPEWTWDRLPLGVALDLRGFPVHAVDWMTAHGVRGRIFNHMHQGAYLAWRVWPDRTRLPFITGTPEAATAEQRRLYVRALSGRGGWDEAQRRYGFDVAILDRHQDPGDSLLDVLDDDPAWASVFMDDGGALFVRRAPFAALADSFAYREVPAGNAHLVRLFERWEADSSRRVRAAAELERQIAESPRSGIAHRLMGDIAGLEGHLDDARRHLGAAAAEDPSFPRVHMLLGGIALEQGRPADALREFQLQIRYQPRSRGMDLWLGRAHQALGDREAARRFYRRALQLDPGNTAARDSLSTVAGPRRDQP